MPLTHQGRSSYQVGDTRRPTVGVIHEAVPPKTRLIFFSPNGGHCCARAQNAAGLLVASLLNESAVAAAARDLPHSLGRPVTVVACGCERWAGSDTLRPCLEDELAAGAIISAMGVDASPEAHAAARTFEGLRGAIGEALWECGSGRELRERGFGADVRFVAAVDQVAVVPVRGRDGWIASHDVVAEAPA